MQNDSSGRPLSAPSRADSSIAKASSGHFIDHVIREMKLTNDPKSSGAALCVGPVVSDNGEISNEAGAAVDWGQYGFREPLVIGNGAAPKSTSLTDVLTNLGIILERTIAGRPDMRGRVERYFLSCKSLEFRLAGRTFSNIVDE